MIDNHPQHKSELVLARLRSDINSALFLPDAPPLPQVEPPFFLRPVDTSPDSTDATLVAEWMNRPHLVETWEQPWSAPRWQRDWEAKARTTYARAAILHYATPHLTHTSPAGVTSGELNSATVPDTHSVPGAPVGYIEIYRPHRDEIGTTYRSQPHDLGIHIAIGEPDLTGRGIFSPFLHLLAQALLAADPDCELVLAEPDYRNERMHRALAKADYQDYGERQQRADRRVRLFGFTSPAVPDAHKRLGAQA